MQPKSWLLGAACLTRTGAVQHQYLKGAKFAKKYPGVPVIINHLGTPTADDLKDGGEIYWAGMKALADAGDHVYIKISMLCCE
eukprot:SAG31_NODE_2793_length_5083_cov_5.043339_3_plen_83_part_00